MFPGPTPPPPGSLPRCRAKLKGGGCPIGKSVSRNPRAKRGARKNLREEGPQRVNRWAITNQGGPVGIVIPVGHRAWVEPLLTATWFRPKCGKKHRRGRSRPMAFLARRCHLDDGRRPRADGPAATTRGRGGGKSTPERGWAVAAVAVSSAGGVNCSHPETRKPSSGCKSA